MQKCKEIFLCLVTPLPHLALTDGYSHFGGLKVGNKSKYSHKEWENFHKKFLCIKTFFKAHI